MTWDEEMADLQSAKYLLDNLDVLTVHFEGGSQGEFYVVTSIEDKIQGLSSLDFLDTDGMLFCFAQDSYIPFTMRDMKINLSIAFFDSSGGLLSSGSYEARDPAPVVCSNPPYRYVLECPENSYGGADLKI